MTITNDGRDFGVARLLYESASGDGRRSIGYLGTLATSDYLDAVIHGIDTHWMSSGSRWSIDNQLMASEKADTNGYGLFMDVSYTPTLGLSHSLGIDALDENLDAYRIWAICVPTIHTACLTASWLWNPKTYPPGCVIGP